MKNIIAIEKRLSGVRRSYLSLLSMKVAEIYHSIYGDNDYLEEYNETLYLLYKTAQKSKKEDWKYNCEEIVLSLTRS